MGQKTHPRGFRLAVNRRWRSRWFEARRKNYTQRLHEDIKLRAMVFAKLDSAGVSDVVIERAANKVMLYIYSARPGLVIGKKGAGIEGLKKDLQGISQSEIFINIREVRKAECDPRLVAVNVGLQLERRVAFRRAMKKAVQTALKFGAKGIRIACSGRLGGGEMARYEWYLDGRVPLHTLRAEIDYGFYEARTTYGTIGVKCWIFKGEVLPESAAAA